MLWGLVEENGGREVSSVLKAGQSITIPKGLMHFGQNLGCEPAQVIESFPHRDGGVQVIIPTFFKLPMSVIRQTLGVDGATIEKLKKAVEANPGIDPECARRCGI
jgi:oxalate decarboxylase/phosphoglucose isomerase-like protein (cupin superfamily)